MEQAAGPDHGPVQEGEAGGMRRRCKISRRRCKRCKRRRRCKRREEAREAGARLVQRSCVQPSESRNLTIATVQDTDKPPSKL